VSAALEARYRAALRWYPRAWRAENADAIVGTMLDQADAEGRATPLRGELRDLASSGISQRFERLAPQVVRDRVAAIALAIGAAYAFVMFTLSEWAPFAETGPLNGWMFPAGGPVYSEYSSVGFGPFASVLVIVHILWMVAFALVMLQLSKTAIAVLLLTVPLLAWTRTLRFDDLGSLQPSSVVLILAALVAVLACIGRPARIARGTVAAIAVAVVAIVLAFLAISGHPPIFQGRLSAASGSFSVLNAPVFAGALVLAGVILAVLRHRAWAVASLVSAAPWLALATLYLLPLSMRGFGVAFGLAALSLVAGLVVWNRMTPTSAPSSLSS